jgi:hypothetical protein
MARTNNTALILISALETRIRALEVADRELRALLVSAPSAAWLTVAEVALLTGRSERAVRGWGRQIGRRDDRGAWQFEHGRLREFLIDRYGEARLPGGLR